MNGEFWARGKPSFTHLLCGKQGSDTLDHTCVIPIYLWDSDEKEEQ